MTKSASNIKYFLDVVLIAQIDKKSSEMYKLLEFVVIYGCSIGYLWPCWPLDSGLWRFEFGRSFKLWKSELSGLNQKLK